MPGIAHLSVEKPYTNINRPEQPTHPVTSFTCFRSIYEIFSICSKKLATSTSFQTSYYLHFGIFVNPHYLLEDSLVYVV